MVLFAGLSYFRVRVSSSACTKGNVQYKTSSVKCTSTSWNLHAAILDLWIQPLVFSPRTKTQPIMKTLNFIAQCSLRNAMLSLTVLVVFWSLCKFCTELKNVRFYTVILFFFFLYIFFLKRNNHFWGYHKRKKCLM